MRYDLEDRTFLFAKNCRILVRELQKSINSIEDSKQLLRSSGSVGANYIEANEAVSKKDFIYRIKICRKEAKESVYWLKLLEAFHENLSGDFSALIKESEELKKIFSSIINKSEYSEKL